MIVDTKDERERLYSFVGIFAFVFIGFVISAHPAKIRWRHVIWGLGIEFVFGLLVLRWEVGRNVFQVRSRSTFLQSNLKINTNNIIVIEMW